MNKLLPVMLAALMLSSPVSGLAQDSGATVDDLSIDMIRSAQDVTLEEFLWIKRPILVFADSPADPRYVQQMQYLLGDLNALDLRDVVIITDTDPAARSAARLALRPRGFMLAVIDKDGGIKQRKPLPWSVREISRVIDKMPTRQQEIEDRTDGLPRG
ncbi:MAG: DUF4174 domain-containing protein [Marivita sp.]|uniref:DUF4174 domain-containing protein n=1 Tax=Marivita sp. TaxID=2003365 RepID=UPI003EF35294